MDGPLGHLLVNLARISLPGEPLVRDRGRNRAMGLIYISAESNLEAGCLRVGGECMRTDKNCRGDQNLSREGKMQDFFPISFLEVPKSL